MTNNFYQDVEIHGTLGAENISENLKSKIAENIYPIGSIYMSTSSTSPASIFGGTWESIQDRFLLGAGGTYVAGDIGGEAMHTLTIEEMPKHTHGSTYTDSANNKLYGWLATTASNPGGEIGFQAIYIGNGDSHNNMPPYLAVYMWKRIA